MQQEDEELDGVAVTLPTEAEQELAAELVKEALQGYEHVLEPEEVDAIRTILELDLLFTMEGRRSLRACTPDPAMDSSGNVPLTEESAAEPKRRKRGTGGA